MAGTFLSHEPVREHGEGALDALRRAEPPVEAALT